MPYRSERTITGQELLLYRIEQLRASLAQIEEMYNGTLAAEDAYFALRHDDVRAGASLTILRGWYSANTSTDTDADQNTD